MVLRDMGLRRKTCQTWGEDEGENAAVTALCLSGAPSTTLLANQKARSLEEVSAKTATGEGPEAAAKVVRGSQPRS